MNAVCALLLRAKADGGAKTNDRRLVLLLLSLNNSIVNGLEVTIPPISMFLVLHKEIDSRVTVIDVKNLPAVRRESLLNILGERNRGITINGNVCGKRH